VGENGGGDTLLTCVPSSLRSRNIPNLGLEVGVEIRDLRQGAVSQSRVAKGTDLPVQADFMCAMPTLLGTLSPQFKQLPMVNSCAPGTVRCTCVQKGGGSMCALQGARRTGAFRSPGGWTATAPGTMIQLMTKMLKQPGRVVLRLEMVWLDRSHWSR